MPPDATVVEVESSQEDRMSCMSEHTGDYDHSSREGEPGGDSGSGSDDGTPRSFARRRRQAVRRGTSFPPWT
eukprot:3365616-Alexandrium_andersonii.AAC.1